MSSYLQTIWHQSDNYSADTPFDLILKVNKIFDDKQNSPQEIDNYISKLSLDVAGLDASKINVLSQEGFTCAYIDNSAMSEFTNLRQQKMAEILAGLSNKVLMIVRDPIDWVYSAYAQYIHQGGHYSLHEYFNIYEKILLDNLNIKKIIRYWKAVGLDVQVIPLELMKLDADKFWQSYSRLDVPIPDKYNSKISSLYKNETKKETVNAHAACNELLSLMETSYLGNYQKYDISTNERDKFVSVLQLTRKIVTRRFCHMADNESFDQLSSLLNQEKLSNRKQTLCVETEFRKNIDRNFIQVCSDKFGSSHPQIIQKYNETIRGVER